MFLVSVYEKGGFVEASLGGRLTPSEMFVFGEEIARCAAEANLDQYRLLVDQSAAETMDPETLAALANVKCDLFGLGVLEIISVVKDVDDREQNTTHCLQRVLEGLESFVLDPDEVAFRSVASLDEPKAA